MDMNDLMDMSRVVKGIDDEIADRPQETEDEDTDEEESECLVNQITTALDNIDLDVSE